MRNNSGQGAIEYLLIIAAAILVVAIVILAVTGALEGGQEQTTFSNISVQQSYSALDIKFNYQKTGLLFGSEITPSEEDPLENGLYGLWHWNGDYDNSGPSTFAINGGPVFVDGLWGNQSLNFISGEELYVEIEDLSPRPQQVTYSIWFKPTQANNNYIFSLVKAYDASGDDPDVFNHSRGRVEILPSQQIYFIIGSYETPDTNPCWDKWTVSTSTDTVLMGQWNHFVGTVDYDDNQKIKLYLNGEFQSEISNSDLDCYLNDGKYVWIGRRKQDLGQGKKNFVGQIEEFAMWRRVFSDEEVENLFDKGAAYSE